MIKMGEERSVKITNELILGIDICNNISQVSYYDAKTQTAESVPLIGTSMILKNPVSLDIIFENVQQGLPIQMNELTNLVGYLLDSAKKIGINSEVSMVCVTVEEFNITLLDALRTVFSIYGFQSDKISFISHEESYAYYAYNMKKELWNGGVLLLDYSEKGIAALQLSNIKIKNNDIIVEERQLFEDSELLQVINGEKSLDEVNEVLVKIIKLIMNGKVISSIYLTGIGFDTDHLPTEFLKFICNKHRVFVGQNLYVKGACLAAYEEAFATKFTNTIVACKNRITTGIEIGIVERGKNRILRVVKPGTNWYEAHRTMDFIVDDCIEISIKMIPVAGKEPYEEIIDLSEFPYRTNKTTRIRMEFEFTADDRCLVTVKDKGFGEFARSSGKVIYKNLEL